MKSKILVPAKSENQKALNIFVENGDLVDRAYPSINSGTKSDMKVSLYLVGLPPNNPIYLKFENYISNNELIWENGLKSILNLYNYSASTLTRMYAHQDVDLHRVFFVNDINDVQVYIDRLLQLINN